VGDGNVTIVDGGSHAFRWDGSVSPNPMEDTGGPEDSDSGTFAVSDDGNTVVGSGFHDGLAEAWIATIPEPGSFVLLFFGAAGSLRRRSRPA